MGRGHGEAMAIAADLAGRSHGVVSRRDLRAHGVDRHDLRTLMRRDAVVPLGTQAIHVRSVGWHDVSSPIVAAVIDSGEGAWADGVSALLLAGLRGWEAAAVEIGLPPDGNVRPRPGAREHRVRGDLPLRQLPIRRAREDVAAVRGASFAPTDRAAGALLAMVVQQRLTTARRLEEALSLFPTLRRRRIIGGFIRDIGGGSQSIDELAFVRHLRRRGLPLPDRQVVLQGPTGRWYLDARWDAAALVVEIDGVHHGRGAAPIGDALRQNAMRLTADRVLRIPNIGLRSDPDAFLDQIADALHAKGVV